MNWTKIKNLLNKDAVIDNNVICDFTELGCIEILNKVFSKVLIPESIINDEVNIEGSIEALNRLTFQATSIETLEAYTFMARILTEHGGLTDYDAEVISIAYEKFVLCTSNEKRMMTVCEENNIELTAKRVSIECEVGDVDNDWVKVSFIDKKGVSKIKIIRLESIYDIELI